MERKKQEKRCTVLYSIHGRFSGVLFLRLDLLVAPSGVSFFLFLFDFFATADGCGVVSSSSSEISEASSVSSEFSDLS